MTTRYELIKCALSKHTPTQCDQCRNRFICLTTIKITNEDKLAYKSIPSFIMNIPNTVEGRALYKQMKKHLNKERYKLQRHGRAKNRKKKGGGQSFTPIGNCDYFGVYLRDSEIMAFQRMRQYQDKGVKYDN